MSTSRNKLRLVAVTYAPEDGRVHYALDADGELVEFTAIASDRNGIRGVEFPEEFDTFLRGYMAIDGLVVRRLVKATWGVVDGGQPKPPIELVVTS